MSLSSKKLLYGSTNRVAVGGKPEVDSSDKQGGLTQSSMMMYVHSGAVLVLITLVSFETHPTILVGG